MIKRLFENKLKNFLVFAIFLSIGLNCYFLVSHFISITEQNTRIEGDKTLEPAVVKQEKVVSQNIILPQWILNSDGTLSLEVDKCDKLSNIISSANLSQDKIDKITTILKASSQTISMKVGNKIIIQLDGKLETKTGLVPQKILAFLDNYKLEIVYNNKSDTFEMIKSKLPVEVHTKLVSGTVKGNLFSSIKRAGADSTITKQLVNLFSYDVDFQRDIKIGDAFKILYEYQTDYRHKIIKNTKIVYASISANGKQKELYRHVSSNNLSSYFDKNGNSIKRSLLKTPISGAKITSNFGYRTHPVLGYSRMHQGLDYGAPKGTPILAAGDGIIVLAKSLNRGYGKHLQIKHTASYSTLYGHLSKFATKINVGAAVKQGQVIGYVGDTGLASGPHLHYEVILDGKKINPAKVKASKFLSLQGKELASFKNSIKRLDRAVATLHNRKTDDIAFNSSQKSSNSQNQSSVEINNLMNISLLNKNLVDANLHDISLSNQNSLNTGLHRSSPNLVKVNTKKVNK